MRPRLAALLSLFLVAQACAPLGRRGDKASRAAAARRAETSGAESADGEALEASLRGKNYQAAPGIKVVLFEYDQAQLDEAARATLKQNAAWLAVNPKMEVQVQGHCDERGTVEYNLALGQRRAAAVRDYYLSLGVPMRRMSTISFGREQPVCADANESCWRANRRAETRARVL